MNRTLRTSRAALCAAALLLSIAAPAQDAAAIFKDKTVDIYTGYTVDGGYPAEENSGAEGMPSELPSNVFRLKAARRSK